MKYINIFCNIVQDHSLALTNAFHIFIVSNNQVYSNDEFGLWPVYSDERFWASWPSCYMNNISTG